MSLVNPVLLLSLWCVIPWVPYMHARGIGTLFLGWDFNTLIRSGFTTHWQNLDHVCVCVCRQQCQGGLERPM